MRTTLTILTLATALAHSATIRVSIDLENTASVDAGAEFDSSALLLSDSSFVVPASADQIVMPTWKKSCGEHNKVNPVCLRDCVCSQNSRGEPVFSCPKNMDKLCLGPLYGECGCVP